MRRTITTVISALALLLSLSAQAGPRSKTYREALNLYQNGMYERARTLFESLGDNSLYQGYAALCAGKLDSPDFDAMLDAFDSSYKGGALYSELHFQKALNLFDDGKYAEAVPEFEKADPQQIEQSQLQQYIFKHGYSFFALGKYPEAKKEFTKLEELPVCQYSSPARYAMGFMNYTEENFSEALKWFGMSVKDPRFQELSNFYIVDCKFMQKDYGYVTTTGVELYDKVPRERQAHLSRIISESFLVLGNKEKAREFYDKDTAIRESTSNSDYFYAGSVMYAVGDYKGAIENYTKMRDKSDSLGQIAWYQLGNSYIQTRNKVAALDAFKAASDLSFDKEIQEDASFNHAKLAFDLNNDGSWFEKYLQKYSTSRKGDTIYGYMALARLVNRNYAGSISAYDRIASPTPEQDRNYLKANYLRANQLIAAGSYADAIPFLKGATLGQSGYDPFCQLAKYWSAECSYRTEDYQTAFSGFNNLYNISALDGKPEGNMIPYNIAYSAFKSGNYEQAAKWFDRFIADGPEIYRQDARNRRADCDFARKDYKAAVQTYQKAIDAGSLDDLYPYYRQALCYGLSNQKQKKADVLEKVEKINPSTPMYPECVYELGRTWLDLKSNEKAVASFARLVKNSSDRTWQAKALIGEGLAYTNLGKYEPALDCYKKVVSTVPGTEEAEEALLAIESIYQTTKQPAKYLEYVESNNIKSGKTEQDREELYFNAAQQSYLAGNYQQTLETATKYLDAYPQGRHMCELWYYTGECYKARGDKEKAADAYGMAASNEAASSFRELSLLNFSRISEDLERFQEAYLGYEELARVAAFKENKAEGLNGMMRCAYAGEDYASAIAAADKAGSTLDAQYYKAKSLLATSRRTEAMKILRTLSAKADTPQGAEANWILIQDAFDRGEFSKVQDMVYEFSPKAGNQNYWLARAYLTLGDAFLEKGNAAQAKATYESIRDGYTPEGPDDDIVSLAAEKISRL